MSSKPIITLYEGDDYSIIWKDDRQIFCYHGSITACVNEVCDALDAVFDTADAEESEVDWDDIVDVSLTEFNAVVRNKRAATIEKELAGIKAVQDSKKAQLKALRKSNQRK